MLSDVTWRVHRKAPCNIVRRLRSSSASVQSVQTENFRCALGECHGGAKYDHEKHARENMNVPRPISMLRKYPNSFAAVRIHTQRANSGSSRAPDLVIKSSLTFASGSPLSSPSIPSVLGPGLASRYVEEAEDLNMSAVTGIAMVESRASLIVPARRMLKRGGLDARSDS